MIPFLFSDTYFETPTYYVLYLLAFLGAIVLLSRRAIKYGFNPVVAVDLGMVCFVFGVLGSRLFHILFESFDYYLLHPVRIFYLWQGGFVLYGGLVLGTIAGLYFLRSKGERPWAWADLAAPSMMLGIGIGRFGCLAAGCCYGTWTPWWWGMVFTDPRSAAPLHITLHPTQLLESLYGFLAAAILCWIARNYKLREGNLFLLMGFGYSVFRFFIEFIRGDRERGLYLGDHFSTSQIISVAILFLIAFVFYFRRSERSV
jgi:phosphatidylglycerol:prolipoprotein diacylglycerol transferase